MDKLKIRHGKFCKLQKKRDYKIFQNFVVSLFFISNESVSTLRFFVGTDGANHQQSDCW